MENTNQNASSEQLKSENSISSFKDSQIGNTIINKSPSFFENSRLLIKGFTLAFLTILLMIPQFFIYNLITERSIRKQDVVKEVSNKWASQQTITGPMIAVPYLQKSLNTEKIVLTTKKYFYLMPENLLIDGKLIPEERTRSLFKVILYKSDLNISGNFSNNAIEKLQIPAESILWGEARLLIGISDYKGLQENLHINWNAETKLCDADFMDKTVLQKSMSTSILLNPSILKNQNTFSANLKLKGTGEILFVPVGNNSKVHITSSWKVPDFRGNTLATYNKDYEKKGVDATWQVLGINRDFPQQWKDVKPNLEGEAFGINLLQSIDSYGKTTRTIKYAILVIVLTFAVYYFTEIFNKKWVHSLQYILIGFALVLFYTLLLSISEYTSFNVAYGISGMATIGLIAAYTHSIFSSRKTTGLFTAFLSIIYFFIFMLVQLEDTALIVGSIGLFLILASIMFASRKVDWFQKQ
jgi:inner membrane protein